MEASEHRTWRHLLARNARLRAELAAIRFQLALRRAHVEAKYNPNWATQPRAARGASDGGQWVNGGGGDGGDGGGGAAKPEDTPKQDRPRTSLRRPSVNLAEEEGGRHRGHTLTDHVGKSPGALLARIRRERVRSLFVTLGRLRVGSFPTVAAANRLVNSTLAQNSAIVNAVASGSRRRAFVTAWFRAPTGIEAYASNDRMQPILRTTYGVGVSIIHDATARNGFRVVTAYPRGPRT